MRPGPKISVLMPAYNAAAFVREAVASVLAQDHPSFELIVIDDASTDKTWERLRPYARDPRVRLYRRRHNRGESVRRNELLRLSRGEYVVNLDADDVMVPGRLRYQADFLDAHPNVGVVFGDTVLLDFDAEPILVWRQHGDESRHCTAFLTDAHHACAMARRRTMLATGGYRKNLRVMADIAMWLALEEVATFAYQPRAAFLYRMNRGGLTYHRKAWVADAFEDSFRWAARRRAWAGLFRARVAAAGRRVLIETNSEELLRALRRWHYPEKGRGPALRLEWYETHSIYGIFRHVPYVSKGDGCETYFDRARGIYYWRHAGKGVSLLVDRRRRRATAYAARAGFLPEDELLEYLFLRPLVDLTSEDGLHFLHASAVARRGRALVLAGPSYSGKTSLALRLRERGWSLLGDETCALAFPEAGRARVRAFPRRPQVKDAALRAHPALRRFPRTPSAPGKSLVRVPRGEGADRPWPLGALAFLRWAPTGPARVARAGADDLLDLLKLDPNYYACFGERGAPLADYLLNLRALARAGRVFECRYSDSSRGDALRALERAAEEG